MSGAKGKPAHEGVTVGRSYKNDVSRPVRAMATPSHVTSPWHVAAENPSLFKFKDHKSGRDPVVQSTMPRPQMPDPILNFDGIPFPGVVCNCAPPDTNGEVGLDQYVQIVNEGFQVFDKNTGLSVFGPVAISSVWTGFGGLCENNGFGDPVVVYDQLANRWVITQFAGAGFPITDQCIAVSTSSDASGAYARYGFHMTDNFYDYPKFGVWPDAYYASANIFNASGTAFLGPQAYAFDRDAMLAGNPAAVITAPLGAPTDDAFMPADLDGLTPPPAGAPNPYLSIGTNATWPLHHFHVDFTTPELSTWTVAATLTHAPFTVLTSLVPQLGGDGLDGLADRGMFRNAYRNFGDHEALVGNMTVSSGGVAGVRWFEVNNVTSGTPSFVQESTYQPDSTWRWMGSAAMDGNGNLAVGFSASSPAINPQIRYAGRLASDLPGTLGQGEAHLFDGTGSQLDTVSRWGDYSDMTVDPVDDCTFWYTQEYYQVTSSFNWRTRIGNFKFPSCTSAPSGTLQGTVTDSGTGNPIAGAHIDVAPLGASTTTGPDGTYSLTLPVGDYDVTASSFGYAPQTQPASVTDGGTTTLDFALVAAPSGSLSGTVTDNASNPIENATVTILGTPIPPATTDATGQYSFASVPEGTYDVKAEAGKCNDSQTDSVVISGATVHDFSLPSRHDSFGYFCRVETPAYIEGDTPLGLSGDDNSTSVSLPFAFSLYGQSYNTAYVCTNGHLTFLNPGGSFCPFTNSGIPSAGTPNAGIYPYWDDMFLDGSSTTWTKTLSSPNRFVIEWRNAAYFGDFSRRVDFEVILYENGQILTEYRNIADDARERGSSATLGIENEAGSVAFQYSLNEAVIGSPDFAIRYLLPPSGFVEGHVTDVNDNAGLGGASVKALQNGNVVRQTSTDGSGFYRMQLAVGDYTIEASKTNYETASADVTIIEDGTATQDFSLRTPRGTVSPTSLEFVVPANQTRTKTLTLSNTGSLSMTWDVQESGGGAAAPATAKLTKNPDYNPNSRTTKGMYEKAPAGARPDAPGDVLRQWSTGLSLGWGVGYDGNVWLSDVDGGFCGPTCTDSKFAVTGPPPLASFTTPWAGAWPGDMAPTGANEMCQVNVGGDNGIYCWDTGTGAETRHISGSFPWASISQRGLAYRPDDDSFYIGGWNQGILYHVAGFSHPTPGQVLNQCNAPDFNISGLAWNPAVGQVWEATNSPTDTIYRVDPTTCASVSTIAHPNPFFNGAGLEMDESGNLWMIGQNPNTAYLVDSGVPAFSDVPWLSENPTSGTIAAGGHTDVQVTVNTAGMSPGVYQATLTFRTNSGRQPNLSVPVRLIVPAYQQGFNSGGGAYTDVAGDLWSADRAYTPANGSGYVQSPPKTVSTRSPIGGTLDDPLYQDARISPMSYRFTGLPSGAGAYKVELKFAEIQGKKPGKRQFDVIVNGSPYLIAFDIAALAGQDYALDRTLFVNPIDGEINVQLATRRSNGEPILNAVRVTHRPDH